MKLESKQGTQSFIHLNHIILVPILGCGINKKITRNGAADDLREMVGSMWIITGHYWLPPRPCCLRTLLAAMR